MGNDIGGARVRERVWVTKIDHTEDPPRVVEEVFIENGQVQPAPTEAGKEEPRDDQ